MPQNFTNITVHLGPDEKGKEKELLIEASKVLYSFNEAFKRWDKEYDLKKRQHLIAELRGRHQDAQEFIDERITLNKNKKQNV